MKRVKVAVTGAAGQIGYSLLFRLVTGEVFGEDTQVDLGLLEVPQVCKALEGIAMELEDCVFPTLGTIQCTDDPAVAFDGAHWVLLVGASPRGPGMERIDLIRSNGPIFVTQGKALLKADSEVRVVAVGNPCNTNALIAASNAQDVPEERFSAMMALDENRARSLIAQKAACAVGDITNLAVWGNHSPTMYPDFEQVIVAGKKATEVIGDKSWFVDEFIPKVQQRGSAIIKVRGKSSAASAASACLDHIKRLLNKGSFGSFHSFAVLSTGAHYQVPKGIMCSFPVYSKGNCEYEVYPNLTLSEFAQKKLQVSVEELLKERELVKDFLKS